MKRKKASIVIVEKEGLYLIGKRAKYKTDGSIRNNFGKWEFLGGKVEKDESTEEAAIREVKEEGNIEIRNLTFKKQKEVEIDNIIYDEYIYLATYESGEIEGEEHDEFKWCTIEEFKTYKMLNFSYEEIRDIMNYSHLIE